MVLLVFVVLMASTCIAGIPSVSAHAPASAGSNEDIANATLIGNPEKSYAIYSDLHQSGEAQYYEFPMKTGQHLYGSVMVPGPGSMVPDIVIMGPGIPSSGNVPSYIEIPPGAGAMVITGTLPGKPTYEPFSPQPIYEVARFNVTIPEDGDYYLAVYGPDGGEYSLAPGFLEQFTLSEWLFIPFSVISIYLWEGQSIALIFAPFLIIVLGGLVLLLCEQKKVGKRWGYREWIVLTAGLLYLGGAGITAAQAVHTVLLTGYSSIVLVTLIFIAAPLILGIILIRTGLTLTRDGRYSRASGVWILLAGFLGFVVWAGLFIGPVLAIVGGALVLVSTMEKNKS
jgi:hypothetical protein